MTDTIYLPMDLQELNSGAGAPATKPWLNPVAHSIECVDLKADSIVVQGRILQEQVNLGHLTPYNLWRSTNSVNCAGGGLIFAMGTYIGPASIPSGSCYAGMATKIKVCGLLTQTGANTMTVSIRNLAGSYVHASIDVPIGGPVADLPVVIEFGLQVPVTGGAGVGVEYQYASKLIQTDAVSTVGGADSTTFSTTSGVEYYLYVEHDTPLSNPAFLRQLAYATVEA